MDTDTISPDRYVTRSEAGTWRLTKSRVSLDSIVINYQQGDSAEIIQHNFPVLTLEQVYGAITFYLANRAAVDAYLVRQREVYEVGRARAERHSAALLLRRAGTRHAGVAPAPVEIPS